MPTFILNLLHGEGAIPKEWFVPLTRKPPGFFKPSSVLASSNSALEAKLLVTEYANEKLRWRQHYDKEIAKITWNRNNKIAITVTCILAPVLGVLGMILGFNTAPSAYGDLGVRDFALGRGLIFCIVGFAIAGGTLASIYYLKWKDKQAIKKQCEEQICGIENNWAEQKGTIKISNPQLYQLILVEERKLPDYQEQVKLEVNEQTPLLEYQMGTNQN